MCLKYLIYRIYGKIPIILTECSMYIYIYIYIYIYSYTEGIYR